MRKTIESYGYDADCTPIDTLMAGPDQMHRDAAEAMEFPEEQED